MCKYERESEKTELSEVATLLPLIDRYLNAYQGVFLIVD